MVNPRAKGSRIARKAVLFLQERGYRVAIVERTGRFIKEKDLYGIGDLLAIKPTKIVIVQVTCNRPKVHKPFIEFTAEYPLIEVMQMIWYDHKGWRFICYKKDQKIDFNEWE